MAEKNTLKKALILDHGKTTADGELKYQDGIDTYGWNIHQFNKVEVGDKVIFRSSGKTEADRKFKLYACGTIESISEPDSSGFVVAKLKDVNTLEPAIVQGDDFIENYEWDSKKRASKTSWGGNFWNPYGMNIISLTDYDNLTSHTNLVPLNPTDYTNEDIERMKNENISFAQVEGTKKHSSKRTPSRTVKVVKNIDWNAVQNSKNHTGALGEEIVMKLLTEEAKEKGLKAPVHASVVKGDGLGFDIIAFNEDGDELRIEVKTTKTNQEYGFIMTSRELEVSKQSGAKYFIYRIYGLDKDKKTYSLEIYKGPIDADKYQLKPTSYKVFKK